MKPAAERGGIRHSMGILYRRGRPFPTTSVYKISPERFTAGDQASPPIPVLRYRAQFRALPRTSLVFSIVELPTSTNFVPTGPALAPRF